MTRIIQAIAKFRASKKRTGARKVHETAQRKAVRYFRSKVQHSKKTHSGVSRRERDQLWRAFQFCDRDNDGVISCVEAEVVLKLVSNYRNEDKEEHYGRKELWSARDGGVSFHEFLDVFHEYHKAHMSSAELRETGKVLNRLKTMKKAFDNCDLDGNGSITMLELEICFQNIGLVLSDTHLKRIESLIDVDKGGTIEWSEFVTFVAENRMELVVENASLVFNEQNMSSIPTFLVSDTRQSSENSNSILSKIPKLERIGVSYLENIHKRKSREIKKIMEQNSTRNLSEKISTTIDPVVKIHVLNDEDRAKFRYVHRKRLAFVMLAGVLSGFTSDWTEHWASSSTILISVRVLIKVLVNTIISILEVAFMYCTALNATMDVADITGLILWPLDSSRAFVTASLARAALQIGHPKSPSFGIDPLKESPKWVLLITALLYKGKRSILKYILRVILRRVSWRAAAKASPDDYFYVSIPINAILNMCVMNRVIYEAKINTIGPSASIEMLYELFDRDDKFKIKLSEDPNLCLQLVRSIGCVIVCQRRLHPNLHIILEYVRARVMSRETWPDVSQDVSEWTGKDPHSNGNKLKQRLGWLKSCINNRLSHSFRASSSVKPLSSTASNDVDIVCQCFSEDGSISNGNCHAHQLDNIEALVHYLNTLGEKQEEEKTLILCVIILCLIVDGELTKTEKNFYERIVDAISGRQAQWNQVLDFRTRFVNGYPLKVKELRRIAEGSSCKGTKTAGLGRRGSNNQALEQISGFGRSIGKVFAV